MVDRYLLRYFLAVIDCGSFSKAAKQMNVAQPTLSVGIAKLEGLLGAALFQRSSKRVYLTDAGSRFATHARRIENEFNLAEAEVLDMKPVRALRLGVISTFPTTLLGAALAAARTAGDEERVQIFGGNERELIQRLRRGQIDVALTIVREDLDWFLCEPLFAEGYCVAMHAGHPLASQKTVAVEDLAGTPILVRRHCEVLSESSKHCVEHGVRPFVAFRGMSDDQVLTLVQSGFGATIMPACYMVKGVVRPLLTGFNLTRRIGLLYSAHAEQLRHGGSATLESLRSRFAKPKSFSMIEHS
jgi:DNA-binding transcriptional LysR family regulator